MADNSEPPTPGAFSFTPTPASMSPDQFWGMLQSFTLEQRAMAGQFFWGQTPVDTPTVANTPTTQNTPIPLHQSTQCQQAQQRLVVHPAVLDDGEVQVGEVYCGGGSTDGVSPDRACPPIASVASTPRSSPRTPWATRTPSHEHMYTVRNGTVVQDTIGKQMRARI